MGVDVESLNEGTCRSGTLTGIGATAVLLAVNSVNLHGRKGLYIKNTSDVVLLWGFSSTSCIIPLATESAPGKADGGDIWIDVGENQNVYILAISGSSKTAALAELR